MRLCLLSKMYPPVVGGSGVYAHEIATALGRRGHDVDVYTQAKPSAKRTVEIHDNVSIYEVTRARRYLVTLETLYYSVKTRRVVDFDSYDVIHGTLMPASTIALSDRLSVDTPVVLTSHSVALSEVFAHSAEKPADYLLKYAFHPMNVVMDNVAARAADHIVAISEEMREQLVEEYGLAPDKITRISHGVDTDRFRPREQRHDAVSADRLTLLFVGRLISRKGVELAIRGLAAASTDDVELLIAGTGRLEEALKRLAEQLGVSDRVRFLGYVPDDELPLLYASADVTLFTSNYEGFGLVFLESLASGTPVIGTRVGGIPDLVENGVTGFVVPTSASAIADRIDRIDGDPERLSELSTAARRSVEHRDWEFVAGELESIYNKVVKNKHQ